MDNYGEIPTDTFLVPILLALFFGLVVVVAIYAKAQEKKRVEALQAVAKRLGLQFWPNRDSRASAMYGFLSGMNEGSNRYAYNQFSGQYAGHAVRAFDYHYETYSTDSKGRRTTNHHYYHFFLLETPLSFPELRIYPENFLTRIGQALGFDDIDFESDAFSRAFTVRAKDKKFAYDVCHARFMEFLLAHRGISLEYEQGYIVLSSLGTLRPEKVEAQLRLLLEVEALLPGYVREERRA